MDPRLAIQVYTGPTASAQAAAEEVMHHLNEQQLRQMIAEALYTGRMQGTREGSRVTAARANQNMKQANEAIRELQSQKDFDEFMLGSIGGALIVKGIVDKRNEEEDNA